MPEIVYFQREEWKAVGGNGIVDNSPNEYVVIHHFASPNIHVGSTLKTENETMLGVEQSHLNKGWNGIGYNFVIFLSGHVYEGRGWGRIGAHVAGYNSKAVGIAFAINGSISSLTPAAIEACKYMIKYGKIHGYINNDFKIKGHRDFGQTECPGNLLYKRLGELVP